MRSSSVKTKKLIEELRKLGFSTVLMNDTHAVYQHKETNAVVSLPYTLEYVPETHYRTVEFNIDNYEILPISAFNNLVRS